MTRPDDRARLLPIGQRLGELHPAPGEETRGLLVHTGTTAVLLEDGDAADVWELAHGLSDQVPAVAWGRRQVAAVFPHRRPADVDRVVDDLLARGLLAEVRPDAAGDFLAAHRWYSRLAGLGHTERPGGWVCGIGVPGAPPVREVSPRVYEFWSLAPELGSLAATADFLAAVAAGDVAVTPEETDPAAVREAVVGWLHDLLCVGAGWLERTS